MNEISKEMAITKLSKCEDKSVKLIINYVIQRIQQMDDTDTFISNVCNEKKSIQEMMKFITSEARKKAVNNVAMIADEDVFNWAIHYFDELDLVVEEKHITAKITSNSTVKPTTSPIATINKSASKPTNRKDDLYGGATLFDF